MRVIKFRAWNGHNMVDLYSTTKFAVVPDLKIDGLFIPFGSEWKVMQFTGLHDKNGVEIYEGDIVRCQQGCPHEVVWVEDNGGTFFGGMPGFNLSGLIRNGGKGYAWSGDEEVIGNIHQNPELLK